MFYVYEWYNTENNDIFYVGKGCNNRYKSTSKRNKWFLEYIRNHKCTSRIIAKFDTEKEAFKYEQKRIVELKSKGQARCNLDNGGKGGPQFVWTEEMRKYKSQYNPMKDAKQRKRMSKNNPMKNALISEKVSAKKRKSVIIGEKEFKSVTEAAKYYKVMQGTIIKWCRKGVNNNLDKCKYKNCEQVEFTGIRYNKGGCRPLIYKGTIYETGLDLAKELHLHNSTISKWALKGFDPHGNECRYIDDNEQHIYKPFKNGERLKKPIYVNGVLYHSKADAERQLGLCKGYLAAYIAGTRKNNKYICKYADQQPSCGNTDESTAEGSTTNK